MLKKLLKYWYLVYLLLLFVGVLYVRDVLKRDDSKIEKGGEKKVAQEQKFVNTDIRVINGSNVKAYKAKIKNIDTVYDSFDEIRKTDGFYYEVTGYLYGTEIDCINKICAPEGSKWAIYKDGVNITNKIKETALEDDTEIEIKLEKAQ